MSQPMIVRNRTLIVFQKVWPEPKECRIWSFDGLARKVFSSIPLAREWALEQGYTGITVRSV